jgi:glutathione peroxidase
MSIFEGLTLTRLDGSAMDPSELDGHAVLVVNVASQCGLTPQYLGLEALAAARRDDGLVVLGVPCNQFGGQEPGTAEEIATFCAMNYGITFPMLTKQDVNGADRSPLYQRLVGEGPDIQWNFEKFVLGRDGEVRERFSPTVVPDDPALISAIDAALG